MIATLAVLAVVVVVVYVVIVIAVVVVITAVVVVVIVVVFLDAFFIHFFWTDQQIVESTDKCTEVLLEMPGRIK